MIGKIIKILAIFILGICGGIFSDQVLLPYFIQNQYGPDQRPVYVTEQKEIIIQENIALSNAIEKTEKAVIGVRTKIKSETGTEKILEGSGLIISSDGLVIVLADLVPQGSDFSFFVDGKPVAFQILKRDLKENLALIKVEQTNLSTVSFGEIDSLKLGERVFLIGEIFEGKEIIKVVDEGIVRNFNQDLIKTNISGEINLNSSPLFNIEGKFLGLNTVDKSGKIVAIPVSKIRQFTGL